MGTRRERRETFGIAFGLEGRGKQEKYKAEGIIADVCGKCERFKIGRKQIKSRVKTRDKL